MVVDVKILQLAPCYFSYHQPEALWEKYQKLYTEKLKR